MHEFFNDLFMKIRMILCIKLYYSINALTIIVYETSRVAQMILLLHQNWDRKIYL